MNIGFDIDGVLYKYQEALYSEMVALYGVTCSYGDFWTKEFLKYPALEQDNLIRLRHIYNKIPPPQEWADFLQKLSKEHFIIYVTARPEELRWVTYNTFRKWGFPNLDCLYFVKESKGEIVADMCDLFVEDRCKYIKELSGCCNVVIVAKPWNKDCREGHVVINSILDLEGVL